MFVLILRELFWVPSVLTKFWHALSKVRLLLDCGIFTCTSAKTAVDHPERSQSLSQQR